MTADFRQLYHQSATARDTYKQRHDALDDAIRNALDVAAGHTVVADFEGRLVAIEKILNHALRDNGAQLPVPGEPSYEEWWDSFHSNAQGQQDSH